MEPKPSQDQSAESQPQDIDEHHREGLSDAELYEKLLHIRNGDFSVRFPVGETGLTGKICDTLNEIVEMNETMCTEVTQARDMIGKRGKFTKKVEIPGAKGSWQTSTDAVNNLISDLVQPFMQIAMVISSVAKGNLSEEMPLSIDGHPLRGEFLRIAKDVNAMVKQLNLFSMEVTRVATEVGTEGKLGGQAKIKGVAGVWKDLTDSVNQMAGNLTAQVRNIAEVTTAVAQGDLSRKITVDVRGEIAQLKDTINTMVDQLNSFGSEVTRVAREVGSEGKLGGQANVPGVAGTWKDLTDSVNQMAGNLTGQVRNIAEVTTAVAKGDLSRKITVDVKGEIAELKNTINTMVDQLNSFASEVTRVALEVGTEGILGGQAKVRGVGGVWKDLTDSVNQMASNLTSQVRNIAEVTTAVAKGDLSRKITVDVKGEIAQLKGTINTMVDQLNSFGSEVTRVAREVGSEGKLGGQADVPGVAGTWKDLTDSVNQMASNLTDQVRNIAEVTTAVAEGDLSKKITVDVEGEIAELKNTINTMVDQLNSFGSEVTRVAREVGSEGKLGGQANVPGVAGTWKDLTDSVNQMAGNLTDQVRNIAEVTTAVAKGDLSRKITVDVEGEIAELKNTINTMVEQLRSFASEVTRVAREVGTDGKLGGQANVPDVGGTWKDLTDSVNQMAGNLTDQVRNIAEVAVAVANGDLSRKITVDVRGEILQLKETINTMVDQLRAFAAEVTRVAREVGTDGKLGGQAFVPGVAGTWKDLTDSVNQMTGNLTDQVRNIAEVTKAVASGDLSKTVTIDVKGEILDLKNTINTMVDQLNSFAYEVTRVAREVGTEGELGGQANVRGVAGTWKDLTDSVNMMASNLTSQVRGIAKVVTAVANGNLRQKLSIEAKGEVASLTETINEMIDTLAVFADQVTTVAREVGAEGKLGGQAHVPGASGIWKDLTQNVNQLAANLTTQVRAIADVASAVTKGDFSGTINVGAKGEVEALKDTINQMIANLKATTTRNEEQDWLKSNLAKFTQMLQGQKELGKVSEKILSELARVISVQHGVFYILENNQEVPKLKLLASFAAEKKENLVQEYRLGEALIGQCALEKERIMLTNVPSNYLKISSGLGKGRPVNIIVFPILFEGEVKAVFELASFSEFSQTHLNLLEQLTVSIGIVLNTIESNTRTEELLGQSQKLAQELKMQQEELRVTNDELEEKATLLAKQKEEVEKKNQEIEFAKKSLEEKAAQLTITSQYKSEFLANMSHELRTPLNSLLMLSQQLKENSEGNLSDKQVNYCEIIHSSGSELINLINDILDLSKIESGVVTVDIAPIFFSDILDYLKSSFQHMADYKDLEFEIDVASDLPSFIETDIQRLKQILKNLLSNAFKFTEKGSISISVYTVDELYGEALDTNQLYAAFKIKDTGLGISKDKQRIIFEAFQQAEGSTSRKYGGTGLGLSISRGLANLLGGFIDLESELNKGSIFTLYLPLKTHSYSLSETEELMPKNEVLLSPPAEATNSEIVAPSAGQSAVISDDRKDIATSDDVILLIDNEVRTSKLLTGEVHRYDAKIIISDNSKNITHLLYEFKPVAIVVNFDTGDLIGQKILNQIKTNLDLRHIPTGIIAKTSGHFDIKKYGHTFMSRTSEEEDIKEMMKRLMSYVEKDTRRLLVVDADDKRFARFKAALNDTGVKLIRSTPEELKAIDPHDLDGAVVSMDHASIAELKELNQKNAHVPLIVSCSKPPSKTSMKELTELGQAVVIGNGSADHRLIDQLVLNMHIPFQSLSSEGQDMVSRVHNSKDFLQDRKILIVDDDIRNIFALTSIFEQYQSNIFSAEGGKKSLKVLRKHPDMDVVLMDIMMPDMDGYETIRKIRRMEEFESLPIIAVTAKAMPEDREKCIKAGASEYITKPIDTEELISIIKYFV
ncbi:HAMP domain-containing protein [Marinoscillum furvescens]|uniref:histidine kinase n=1 Tax=Marinoscillum furvescens DSM 4134 TaxID=1122208 RepID=A0A3D9L1F5_MARFU|nr:HAMP domain-containing protein [Marinoscillum furvescens]RED95648.1 GAF sensor hybrid histidine kinase [Marinoscillum furvescens DSM 4134]